MRPTSALFKLTTAAILLAAFPFSSAFSQEKFPSRVVRIVIPTASGGNVDLLARAIGEKLSERWKQPVIVEAKPGANTTLATLEVARGKADGYTLLFTISGLVQNLVLQPNPPYKLSDLAPVTMVASVSDRACRELRLPGRRALGELVEQAKAKPNTISYGSYGTGSGGHIIGEGLNRAAGIDLQHIAVQGRGRVAARSPHAGGSPSPTARPASMRGSCRPTASACSPSRPRSG